MMRTRLQDAEAQRLEEDADRKANWKRWGPYLAERQWATVREDYSPDGECWTHFSHEDARSRAYRWGEDGLLGITDRECRLCFSVALWNTHDSMLKERLFGLTGPQGNHGEDVKECYYYLDSTPTHSYMQALYQYPQGRFPYEALVEENRRRGRQEAEYELVDTGIFEGNRYFDVFVEYAKGSPNDVLISITITNRGPEPAVLHLLPTLWYRNTWIWGCVHEGCWVKPVIQPAEDNMLRAEHVTLGRFRFAAEAASDGSSYDWLFTENATNTERLYGVRNEFPFLKDAFHEYVVDGRTSAVNPRPLGTKVGAHYRLDVPSEDAVKVQLRLFSEEEAPQEVFGEGFRRVMADRIEEADQFYDRVLPGKLGPQERLIARQAYAGLFWTKQFYHFVVEDWLEGDPEMPAPPESRKGGRNADWPHLFSRDVLSVPDKWEYPWFAAWDLAFHMIPFARVDPFFAKRQLTLLLREWYMHPNGQMPAYEFDFGDVNPPVHAWACWQVYRMTAAQGDPDWRFLSSTFQKLLINFTWWVNRKDAHGKHLFSGGFLGLDNIGVFDRSSPLPGGGVLEQADATAWMAFYCATMLAMALELAKFDPGAEDIASKFFEHFVHIADAINTIGGTGLWNEEDGFYYDQMHVDGQRIPLRVRSMVGLIPLFAVDVLGDEAIGELHGFQKRLDWFLTYRRDLARHISYMETQDESSCRGLHLLAIPSRERLQRVLRYVLDESEFLSPYGIRSLSKYHQNHPYVFHCSGQESRVDYVPGESNTGLFGGNSNWRGPIWFPVNYLLIEALQRYYDFYGDTLRVECPTGSGQWMNLGEVANELCSRLVKLFLPGEENRRPYQGDRRGIAPGPDCKDRLLFYEYFHGDTGAGLGAGHQTGWTALVAECLEQMVSRENPR
jgi:hypothetical protein